MTAIKYFPPVKLCMIAQKTSKMNRWNVTYRAPPVTKAASVLSLDSAAQASGAAATADAVLARLRGERDAAKAAADAVSVALRAVVNEKMVASDRSIQNHRMGNMTAMAANSVHGRAELEAAVMLDLTLARLQAEAKTALALEATKAGAIRAHLKKT